MFNIMGRYKMFFGISIVVILVGIITIFAFGLNQDTDFAGGLAMHINIGQKFDNGEIRDIVTDTIGFEPSSIQKAGEEGTEVIIKMKEIDTEKRDQLVDALKSKYNLKQENFLTTENVDPTIGNELKYQAFLSTVIAAGLMLVYISFRFEFKSGVAAVIALVHDLLIMLSVYAIFRLPINTSYIAAMLTILGYSINDTIVIFDRIRENSKVMKKEEFGNVVNTSIWQTMGRSINTALTTLLTITVLYVMGVPSIKEFALPLIIGILAGTYSSIFIASPVWVLWKRADDSAKKTKLKTA